MIQSRAHPRWMHTCAFNFWTIPTLASFQKIQSQHNWSEFGALIKIGTKISSHWEVRCFCRCLIQFIFGGSLESERISCHPYFDFCIRMLPSMRGLDHMNMYNYLGNVQLTRCRDPIFIKELMLKPSLGIPSARLSSDEHKHHNVCQLG